MRNKKVLLIVQAALIAAIYVVLTYFISAFNLASGAIQVRISEADRKVDEDMKRLKEQTKGRKINLYEDCLLYTSRCV